MDFVKLHNEQLDDIKSIKANLLREYKLDINGTEDPKFIEFLGWVKTGLCSRVY
jgi:hypothetical protein